MSYTDTNEFCCGCRQSWGVEEFYGYCSDCWKDLEPEDRATLRGEEPPVKEIVHHVETVYPPKPGLLLRGIGWTWRAAVTAAIAYLVWRSRAR
jgi:hypothetical protein